VTPRHRGSRGASRVPAGMGVIKKLRDLVSRDQTMRRRGERDAPTDPVHGTRESTDGAYVGRAGADEAGDGAPVDDSTGAGRDS
jgi:hypothetical protein